MLQGSWWRVSGLVGALLHAGASNVVMSLWPVPEKVRADLVERFYRGIDGGPVAGEALRRARLEMSGRHPYPAAWAGWVCVGGGRMMAGRIKEYRGAGRRPAPRESSGRVTQTGSMEVTRPLSANCSTYNSARSSQVESKTERPLWCDSHILWVASARM